MGFLFGFFLTHLVGCLPAQPVRSALGYENIEGDSVESHAEVGVNDTSRSLVCQQIASAASVVVEALLAGFGVPSNY